MRDRLCLMRISMLFPGFERPRVPRCLVSCRLRAQLIVGKGQREELDDDEGAELAAKLRAIVEQEMKKEKPRL